MEQKKLPKSEHVIKTPMHIAINNAVKSGASANEIVETVMRTLDQQKMISYSSGNDIALLSPAGRVLVAIMEDPSITQRALSVYLGVTESNVQKSVRTLVNNGLVEKTKIKGRNVYSVSSKALSHPDVSRFYDGILKSKNMPQSEADDSPPF